MLRRLVIGAAGLLVAAVAAAACVLSFDDLRALARQAGARENLAHLYPAAFDALLLIALIGFLALGTARPLVRVQAGFVLLVLLAAASWANVAVAMRFTIDARLGAVIVGVVPWVMLLIALWLLTLLIKHAQVRRAVVDEADDAEPRDIVPFTRAGSAEEERRPDAATPDGEPTAPRAAVPAPPARSAAATAPEAADRSAAAADDAGQADRPAASAVVSPAPTGVGHEPPIPESATLPSPIPALATAPAATSVESPGASGEPTSAERASAHPHASVAEEPQAAPEAAASVTEPATVADESADTRPVKEKGRRRPWRRRSADAGAEAAPTDVRPAGVGEAAGPVSAGEPQPEPRDDANAGDVAETASAPGGGAAAKRPIRWGDLVRRPSGGVRAGAAADTALAEGGVTASDDAMAHGAARGAGATDWEPEETDLGPRERDASTDEAEVVPAETGTRVWPPATSPASVERGAVETDEAGSPVESEADRDTRPYPHIRGRSQPLTRDAAETESSGSPTVPTVPLAPPSVRMRSTPTPPQD